MSRFKKVLLTILIFDLVYAPLRPQAFAQNNALEPVKEPDASYSWTGAIQADGKTLEYFRNGTRVEVQVISKSKQKTSDQKELPDISTSIVPGSNLREIYEAERPFRLRKKFKELSNMGTFAHYAALRHHDPRYSEQAPANMRLDKRSDISLGDVRRGVINLSSEQTMFSITNGAFSVLQLIRNYSKNPMAFQQLIDGTIDPFGNFSFYSFMVANGFSTDFIKDPFLKKGVSGKKIVQSYASVINYMGMAAGTLVSHFTGDMLRLMQQCSSSLLSTVRSEPTTKEKLENDPCEMAWKEWTLEKKFNVYAPAIVSTVSAGLLSGGTTKLITGAVDLARGGVVATGVTDVAAFKTLTNFVLLGARIVGPGAKLHFIVTGTKKILSFGAFIGFQNAIESWVNTVIGNFSRTYYSIFPGADSFVGKANALLKLLNEEKYRGWEGSGNSISCSGKWVQIPFVGSYCKTNDMIAWIQDFADSMQGWREFNQVHAIQAHQNWIQKINNLKSVERASFYFNDEFIGDLQKMNNREKYIEIYKTTKFIDTEKDIKLDEDGKIPEETFKLMSEQVELIDAATYTPKVFRLYPLMGVKPMEWKSDDIVSYINSPDEVEQQQIETVKTTVEDFLIPSLKVIFTLESDKTYFEKLINALNKNLKSQDTNSMISIGIELSRIRVQLAQGGPQISRPGKDILIAFMDRLGKPAPILYYGQGFSEGFEASKQSSAPHDWQQHLNAAVFEAKFGSYLQSKKSDVIFYKMACGIDFATVGTASFINERWGFADEFNPPRIIRPDVQPDICKIQNKKIEKLKPSASLFWDPIVDLKTNKTYQGITSLVYQNLLPDLAELIKKDVSEGNGRFPLWWNQLVEPAIKNQFEKYRQQYEEIAVDFVKSLNLEDSMFNQGAVKNSVTASTQQEIRLYSLILNEMLRDLINLKKLDGKSEVFKAAPFSELQGWKKSQLKATSDIFKMQLSPYNVDLKSLKSNTVPSLFAFQVEIEKLVQSYHSILSKLKIENESGKELVVSTYSEEELKAFEEQKNALEKSLTKIAEQFKNKPELIHAAQIAALCIGKILSLPQQIQGFLLQLKAVEYNRNAGPDKVDCNKMKVGLIKSAGCN